ncbi:MAG: cytochrome c [Hyphomicrobiales bacterium]
MIRRLVIAILGLALLGGAGFWFLTNPALLPPPALPDAYQPDLANGEYVFYAGGCSSCHAAPGAKGEAKKLLVGGLSLKTDFGTFHVPNITPDPNTGIGGWSAADFVTAMTRGVSPAGEHYYPAFPYTSYQRMKVADLIDLKAFLDTLPAATSEVPAHELGFPFNIRRGLGLWKLVYLDGRPFEPDARLGEVANRGAYLVSGPGHCSECHSPRDPLGGIDRGRAFSGAPSPEGDGRVPNITPDPTGIGDWSEKDIVDALKTGFTPEFDSFGGSMVAVQENMAHLSDTDLAAIAAYLKSLPAIPSAPAPAAAQGG